MQIIKPLNDLFLKAVEKENARVMINDLSDVPPGRVCVRQEKCVVVFLWFGADWASGWKWSHCMSRKEVELSVGGLSWIATMLAEKLLRDIVCASDEW